MAAADEGSWTFTWTTNGAACTMLLTCHPGRRHSSCLISRSSRAMPTIRSFRPPDLPPSWLWTPITTSSQFNRCSIDCCKPSSRVDDLPSRTTHAPRGSKSRPCGSGEGTKSTLELCGPKRSKRAPICHLRRAVFEARARGPAQCQSLRSGSVGDGCGAPEVNFIPQPQPAASTRTTPPQPLPIH
jgi:hypothetical protein